MSEFTFIVVVLPITLRFPVTVKSLLTVNIVLTTCGPTVVVFDRRTVLSVLKVTVFWVTDVVIPFVPNCKKVLLDCKGKLVVPSEILKELVTVVFAIDIIRPFAAT